MIKKVSSETDIEELAKVVLDVNRQKPILIVTAPFHSTLQDFDLATLQGLENRCDFYAIEESNLTLALGEKLPPGAVVFNGGCRVYPAGFTADTDPSQLPIRYLTNPGDLERLEADVWINSDVSKYRAERLRQSKPAQATVKSFFEARALVKISGEQAIATIRQELSFPGIPLDWIFRVGNSISGSWDRSEGLFIPDSANLGLDDLVTGIGLGNLTLGLVTEAGRQKAKVKLLPNVELEISKDEITHNDRDVVSDLVAVGDVIPLRMYRNAEGKIRIRTDDVDDDETLYPALALIANGEPWLREDRRLPQVASDAHFDAPLKEVSLIELPTEVSSPERESSLEPSPQDVWRASVGQTKPNSSAENNKTALAQWEAKQYRQKLLEANQKIEQLDSERKSFHERWIQAARELQNLRSALNQSQSVTRRSNLDRGRKSSTTWSRRNRFDNDVDWFNEELRRAWIGRYQPADRKKYVLNLEAFTYSPHFFDSLREVTPEEDTIRKAVRVILDIVTGRENEERRYDVHDLRDGERSAPEARTRADGAEAKRAYLEQNTPQARRLHFWRLGNNGYEISRVAKHDDYRS